MIWPHKTSFNTRYVFIDMNVGGRVFILLGVPILELFRRCVCVVVFFFGRGGLFILYVEPNIISLC